ncbi:Sel1 repeat-containing protein [Halospina denitrificans]|uniref:Sel1 repeat-containing protein n=1 Tax=Halospina denitrificans TaxID=332522 RepID=A0A4R7K1L8_9GAMM|nr:Sel1 repeat-containing protein [Halospina denitrificans]
MRCLSCGGDTNWVLPLDFENIAIFLLRFILFLGGVGVLFLQVSAGVSLLGGFFLIGALGLSGKLHKTRLLCKSCGASVTDRKLQWTHCRPSFGPIKSIPCLRRNNVPVARGVLARLMPSGLMTKFRIFYHRIMADANEEHSEARAIRHLKELEVLGSEQGLIELGARYSDGKGVKEDHEKAYRYFEKAASKNGKLRMYAEYNLGTMHLEGLFVPQDSAKAGEFFEKAAQKGYPPAQYNCGLALIDGWMGYEDYEAGVQWMEKAAAGGITEAQEALERLEKFNQ